MAQDRILVIDDEELQRWAMRKHLTGWNYEVFEAADGHSGLELFSAQLPDLVLLDLQLPDQTGVDVLRQIKAVDPNAVVIMVTAHGGVQDAVAAFKLGLFDFLSKPLDFDALGVTLRYGLEARHLRAEVERLREGDRDAAEREIVGESAAVTETVKMLRKLAVSGASTVLLTGESGTGKDFYAKTLHYGSPRASGPFVPVNCAAIPDTLMESELFGHEKGAFTDARFLKKGVFEMADGGTLYLDEIGELKPALQAKMLRVLETLTFRRVGGTRDIKIDVRVVAATNRDLNKAIETGDFRPDLLYRLRVIEMRLQPLRNRREDIPDLVHHFLREFSLRFHKPMNGVTPAVMDAMCRYDWPGNVRELKNAIERAIILEDGDQLTTAYLPEQLSQAARPAASQGPAGGGFTLPPGGVSLERVEETLVRQAMAMAGGNQTRAAQLLDISRDALRYKLKKFAHESS
jgi:two-component system, NtrC family, response regulator AtoC